MKNDISEFLSYTKEVALALNNKQPIVALETAVLTHGLPHPDNIELSRQLEAEVKAGGATPATVGLLDGKIHIGLTDDEIVRLGDLSQPARKISRRDFGIALARKEKGGTTVTGTMIAARAAGIRVFATGGIGGVHRNAPFDVSADLPELGRSGMIVTCAGAKSILDLPATVEVLETWGVPIVGYQTDEFPGFFSPDSGLPVNVRADSPQEVADIAAHHWAMGLESAILVVIPPPAETAVPRAELEEVIEKAVAEAEEKGISGAKVTPFLLSRVKELSGGSSLRSNLALLRNNSRVAAEIACALTENRRYQVSRLKFT
ncbi:MAG: pseudouridine-5'-phosphate glycosidase [Anaerolineaceae bacterium]|jgi:pseudouridine-5'-phosphate glycosidase|nr:pseudouridine-5'-phosphate glycosidase [Anaerolineaceae bacterium]